MVFLELGKLSSVAILWKYLNHVTNRKQKPEVPDGDV